jgi:glycosyltransferase involved in cell wall biosynthesis
VTGPAIVVPWSPRSWRATGDELAAFRPDLVVVQWWSPLFGPSVRSVLACSRRIGARTIVMCHNDRPHEPFPFWRAITRSALSRADVVTAFAQPVADSIESILPGREIRVSPLPEPRPSASASDGGRVRWDALLAGHDGPVILFFGNVRAYKGLEDLVAALPLVRRELAATLVVAGTFFEPLERFRRQARRLGVEQHVRFVPEYIPDEHVPGLFARAHVVALPHRAATQSGLVGQAAVAGRPVVATAVGALPAAVGDNGVLVPPRDPAGLADGLVRALRDPPPPPRVDDDAWNRWRDLVLSTAGEGSSRAYATT